MIFMIMVLIILSFVVLWNFDLHTILNLKSRTQNAGDAAALGAARWQGLTLNIIGDLNIMQAVALSGNDTNAAAQIAGLQARLAYVGPAIGFLAAQQAAKNNGIYVNSKFTARLLEHARAVTNDYGEMFAEPYTNCWQEYGALLKIVADQGVAAAPDNARLYSDYTGGHTLLTLDFYDAVAGRDWCWFYFNAMDLLTNYTSYLSWPELPPVIPEAQPDNSEIFGLGLAAYTTTLPGGDSTVDKLNELRVERELSATVISNEVADLTSTWYCYDPATWSAWTAFSLEGEYPFPAVGEVKPQYDYAGADAAIRIEAEAERLTPGAPSSLITWTAAAKPFGYLTTDEGQIRPNSCSLVLPAYHNIRLIPVDTSSAPAGGSYNLDWREHIETHLTPYMENGLPGLQATCWYCQQLHIWENSAFREEGLIWLNITNGVTQRCEQGGGGPGASSGGGGRRRGH